MESVASSTLHMIRRSHKTASDAIKAQETDRARSKVRSTGFRPAYVSPPIFSVVSSSILSRPVLETSSCCLPTAETVPSSRSTVVVPKRIAYRTNTGVRNIH
jgi:hypothetical protein